VQHTQVLQHKQTTTRTYTLTATQRCCNTHRYCNTHRLHHIDTATQTNTATHADGNSQILQYTTVTTQSGYDTHRYRNTHRLQYIDTATQTDDRAGRCMRAMSCSKSRSPGTRTVTQCADETGANRRAFLCPRFIVGSDWRVLLDCSGKMTGSWISSRSNGLRTVSVPILAKHIVSCSVTSGINSPCTQFCPQVQCLGGCPGEDHRACLVARVESRHSRPISTQP